MQLLFLDKIETKLLEVPDFSSDLYQTIRKPTLTEPNRPDDPGIRIERVVL